MPWKPASGGNGHKPRSGTKSIRGQISGPIPIPDPLDDEFPMRDQPVTITAVADAIHVSAIEAVPDQDGQINFNEDAQTRLAVSSGSARPLMAAADTVFVASAPAQSPIMPTSFSPAPTQQRLSVPVSDSADTEMYPDRGDKESRPQRKKSTFRSAFSRIFGRKKKTQDKAEDSSPGRKTASASIHMAKSNRQHRSDPTGSRANFADTEQPPRSASMPAGEHKHPLRSHSIGPEDMMLVHSARNSVNVDARLSGTFSSEFESAAQPASPWGAGPVKLAGLSPRPASSHDRGARPGSAGGGATEIGRAVSSDSRGLRRRSRSLSVLPRLDLPSSGQFTARRRSAEIKYWRESYAAPFMSPISATEDESMMRLPGEHAEKQIPPHANRPSTPDDPRMIDQPDVTPNPPSVANTARTPESTKTFSIDGRVGSLENRMSRLEGIVLQLGNSLPGLRAQPKGPNRPSPPRQAQLHPRDRHAINSIMLQPSDMGYAADHRNSMSRPSTQRSDESKMTFGDVGETTPRATVLLAADNEGKSVNATTQSRVTDVSTRRPSSASVTVEHYTNLLALLDTERSAREALEAQVRSLSRQMLLLSKSLAAERDHTPSLNRSASEVSVFDDDDDDEDDDEGHRRRTATQLAYTGLGPDDSGIAAEPRSDDEFTESFVTPAETGNGMSELYPNEDEAALRSEARQLSLSHLTMGQQLAAMQQISTRAM